MAEIDEAGDAVLGDATRHNAVEVGEIGFDVEADAVQADPALQADADGGDFVFTALAFVRAAYPDADAIGANG